MRVTMTLIIHKRAGILLRHKRIKVLKTKNRENSLKEFLNYYVT